MPSSSLHSAFMRQEYCLHSSLDSGRDGRAYQGQTELEDRDRQCDGNSRVEWGILGNQECMYQGCEADIWLRRKQLNEEKRTEEGRVMLQPDGRGQFQLFESAKESRPPPAYPPIAPGDLRPDARARG
ncbi:hypothetical protein GE21DRAFT_7429 [Neurospora crassa]|uniref:Uncharacterized protein n=1 Tax=Neurospora crassa (strain ATCC 24698 / 74-OR23-1A / CBS 708.71 / DSM 1257 / FGSC 987) TaxID=367110 RepID=Q7S821_NEUCR|nr:hypothetical protein NCU01003 [Neurospora crassa OR74A]EAA32379.2 hypothetical protein NCU01003 [Neurospora crassa OR74A]KHE88383.1 hypothetical protein GE21DRAFT_7429 [Neurospora crassa]|eukprot:XP_961615.2 hypothetical protein NCU01003 [Neurospora crassa OR74A]